MCLWVGDGLFVIDHPRGGVGVSAGGPPRSAAGKKITAPPGASLPENDGELSSEDDEYAGQLKKDGLARVRSAIANMLRKRGILIDAREGGGT